MQRARGKVNSISTYGEPELEKEKIITRSICKVLAGFHFGEVPDAVDEMMKKSKDHAAAKSKGDQTLFGQNFSEILEQQLA